LKYKLLNRVFYTAFILCIFSSYQLFATTFFKGGEFKSSQRGFEFSKTCSMDREKVDEFTGFKYDDDMIWFSVAATTSPPVLEIDVTALDFGETETSKSFNITNSGSDTLIWSLSEDEEWITVDITTGSLEAGISKTVTVEVDRSKVFTFGEFDAIITVSSNGGDAEIEVTMTVSEQPSLEVIPSSLDFGSDWVITTQEAWITVDQESGSTSESEADTVYIIVDRSEVTELGSYSDELSVTSDGGDAIVSVAMERINHPPDVPIFISPVDGATDQSIYTTLKCQGGDLDTKDGDTVAYDIYFSTNESLVDVEDISVLTCSNMLVCYCEPGLNNLERNTTYYWKVIAKDSYGEITPSSVWKFTTEGMSNLCPTFALELDSKEQHLLRELRDRVLAKDKDGRDYIKLYYRYSWELLVILFINDELRVKSMQVFRELLPAIKSLIVGDEIILDKEMLEELREIIEKVALYASPQFKEVLKSIQFDIKNKKLKKFGVRVK